jgi:C4-dicarboxylate transporter DctM subunit
VSWRGLWRITVSSTMLTSQILIIVAASGVFSWLLTVSGIPQALVNLLGGSTQSTWVMLLLANVFLLIVGCSSIPFSAAARALNAQLRELLPRLEADNPRKKEWGTP